MKKYFAMIDGEQCGPYTLSELATAGVGPDTYVWCKGMSDWQKARDEAEICRAFRQRLLGSPAGKPASPPGAASPLSGWMGGSIKHRPGEADVDSGQKPDTSVPPQSLLVPAILATVFCCPLTGIAAIFFAMQTTRRWAEGNREEAYECQRKARMWLGITFFLGFVFNAILFQFMHK